MKGDEASLTITRFYCPKCCGIIEHLFYYVKQDANYFYMKTICLSPECTYSKVLRFIKDGLESVWRS